MAFGEHTYDALRKGVIKAITDKFDPDWDVLVLGAWEGFIADMQDDVYVDYTSVGLDGRHVTEEDEILLVAHIECEWDIPFIGKKRPLSDILFEFYDDWGEEFMPLLNNSIAAFKKKAGIEG